ncbi:teichuronopeptide biosynthesis protein [Thiocapsa marina 5811]|uniref:Teichuronopeptide biosynthesis protein n=2 Tax=Thiocapsa marina TaxID=244573 RepID=F9UIK4_9GAMM|nr:teichuronopeptide biosynthesis protein [Thiocapsa marina 5811]
MHDGGYSLASSVNHLIRQKNALLNIGVKNLARGKNPKDKDRSFAKFFNVPVPENYGDTFCLENVPIIPETIVKPYSGCAANGVFYINCNCEIFSVSSGKYYSSLCDGVSLEVAGKNKKISFDRWVVERAILSDDGRIARNLKVFTFYGKVGLFLETAFPFSAGGAVRKSAYDELGNVVKLRFKGAGLSSLGIPDQLRDYSNRISLASPVPFLRIDFLRGSNGLYLGEITPHPGSIYKDGVMTPDLDVILGKMFIDAEARLFKDLLQGKSFDTYREIYEATW